MSRLRFVTDSIERFTVVLNKDIIINISYDLHTKEHIRHYLLYEYKLGRNATEASRNICRGIGKDAASTATACSWFESFHNKDYSLEDEQRLGRPSKID